MQTSKFYEKLNKVDGNIYVIEEEIPLVDGVYEAELQHDNINIATLVCLDWTEAYRGAFGDLYPIHSQSGAMEAYCQGASGGTSGLYKL